MWREIKYVAESITAAVVIVVGLAGGVAGMACAFIVVRALVEVLS